MIKEFFDIINVCVVLVLSWLVFGYVSKHELNYIKNYIKVSLVFFFGTCVLFFLYLSYLKQFFIEFSLTPFLILFIFYLLAFLIYCFMKNHLNKHVIQQNELRRIYSTSMSNYYLISKSFNILFQQMAVICVVALLKDLGFTTVTIMLLFGFAFAFTHIYFYKTKKASMIAKIFIPASFIGGLVFPLIITIIQYGIIYTFIVHWLFYIFLGVFMNYTKSLEA